MGEGVQDTDTTDPHWASPKTEEDIVNLILEGYEIDPWFADSSNTHNLKQTADGLYGIMDQDLSCQMHTSCVKRSCTSCMMQHTAGTSALLPRPTGRCSGSSGGHISKNM